MAICRPTIDVSWSPAGRWWTDHGHLPVLEQELSHTPWWRSSSMYLVRVHTQPESRAVGTQSEQDAVSLLEIQSSSQNQIRIRHEWILSFRWPEASTKDVKPLVRKATVCLNINRHSQEQSLLWPVSSMHTTWNHIFNPSEILLCKEVFSHYTAEGIEWANTWRAFERALDIQKVLNECLLLWFWRALMRKSYYYIAISVLIGMNKKIHN